MEMTPVVERDRVEELRVAKDEVSLENAADNCPPPL